MCICFKKPKGCLKRYLVENRATRRICYYIYIGFVATILILMVISLIYLILSKSNLNGTICSLSMLRYEMMYGQSLLEKEDFKKPFWYGIESLSENMQKIEDLLQLLDDNCHNNPTNIINDLQKTMPGGENIYDTQGRLLKESLES